MKPTYTHSALIIDDDEQTTKAMARMLRRLGVRSDSALDGETGLSKLSESQKPYTLVISDQRMPGMKGHEFLEKVSRLSPDSLRFLMSGYTDMEAIINAVNRGAITRYIEKPWDNDALIITFQACIDQYEKTIESRRLFELAKAQNAKLFDMTNKLKKNAEDYERRLDRINHDIASLEKEIESLKNKDLIYERTLSHVERILNEKKMMNQDAFDAFVIHSNNELFDQFQDIVVRNGFKMPEGLR